MELKVGSKFKIEKKEGTVYENFNCYVSCGIVNCKLHRNNDCKEFEISDECSHSFSLCGISCIVSKTNLIKLASPIYRWEVI